MKTIFTNSTIRDLIFAIALLLLSFASRAQNWAWATSSSGPAQEYANTSCTDPNGNILVAGSFYSNPLQMGTVTLNNSGGGDAYVAKYNSSGTVLWAQKIGGSGNESITGVSTDPAGNIYILGTYNTQFLNVPPLAVTNFTNNSTYDIFVACYNPNGLIQWIKSFGGPMNETSGGCVYSNSLSSLYIAGST